MSCAERLAQRIRHETSGAFTGCPQACVPGRVSVICPTFDERLLFHSQIHSCFAAQTWTDKELIVVDTGSQPSPFFLQKSVEDRRVVYRHYNVPATSWSVGLKRNLAALLASGEFLVHFDDDDLYAPRYIDALLRGMTGADAITLSCWYVCDAVRGLLGFVEPRTDGSQESWILGYGFSHAYRREACLKSPFPHHHFAEDYRFLLNLRASGWRVLTMRDDRGIVLHMQQGLNMSNSHAHHSVPAQVLLTMPVSELPCFDQLLPCDLEGGSESAFLSIGEDFRQHIRPSPHQRMDMMRMELSKLGVPSPAPCLDHTMKDLDVDHIAFARCHVTRCQAHWFEPGRTFGPMCRFSDETPLPVDVPRTMPAEQVALLHVARLLLRRCPPRTPERACRGWVHLRLKTLSHIAVISMLSRFIAHFPCLYLEVSFDSEGNAEDPCADRRAWALELLAMRGVSV